MQLLGLFLHSVIQQKCGVMCYSLLGALRTGLHSVSVTQVHGREGNSQRVPPRFPLRVRHGSIRTEGNPNKTPILPPLNSFHLNDERQQQRIPFSKRPPNSFNAFLHARTRPSG